MFALKHVVLLATALVAAHAQQCAVATYGQLVGREVQLATIYIPPGSVDDEIDIPQACLPSEIHVGTKLMVCDNLTPVVTMTNLNVGLVHRTGGAMGNAPVLTTVYCL